ncbi:MAG: GHKL domain-containing protein [Flavihumibacter sp.]
MRYTVYEANEEKVDLDKEIEYLKSYIDLQQQRFGKNVMFSVQLNEVDDHYRIEPMLLIPFVENAIKHGTGFMEKPSIDIRLKAEKGKLDFRVKNRYNPNSHEIKDKTSGIGLSNVKRRLDLLYQNQYQLTISRNDGWFTVSLQLTLH